MSLSKLSIRAIVLVIFSAFLASLSHAQFKASIQGTVMDPKGAAVAAARVTVTNQDTGAVRDTVASAEGFYRISELPPGKYTVTIEAAGFKKSTSKDVLVEAEQPRGLDVTLEIGAVTEQVTVTASAEALQAEDANLSSTITSEQITRLPQYGRDPYELLRLAPGVFGDGARAADGSAANLPNSGGPGGSNTSIFQVESQVQVTANGQRNSANNFTIDGTSVNSLTWGGAAILTPNQESIQDVTIVANSYSAEDGRNTGAEVKVVSKSGTNQFHGSGFFKDDSPGLNAFNKWGGPDPGETPKRVQQNLRQFGGGIGGPILKDKMFFFFSYEGNRSNDTKFSNPQYVETQWLRDWVAANRAGTVIGKEFAAPGSLPRIVQVLTPNCSELMTSAGWPNYSACNVIPGANGGVDLGSPTGSYGTYVNTFGGDTTGGGLDGNADFQKVITAAPTISSGNQYNARVDYNRTKDRFAVSFYITPLNSKGGNTGAQSRPMADLTFNPRNRYMSVVWSRTLSPTMVNEARANATRLTVNQFASNSSVLWSLPQVQIDNLPGDRLTFGAPQGTNSPAVLAQNQYELRDTLSKQLGRNGLKTGVVFVFNQDNNDYELGAARPTFAFKGPWNLLNGAPVFEGIDIDPRTGAPTDDHKYYRQLDYAFFAQNDIKLRPNLTVNVGLRYEYFAPLSEKFGHQSNLILGSGPNPLQTATLKVGGSLYPADRNNFAPRLGFAWSPSKLSGKTAIRGGFGVAYNRITDTMTGISRVNPPFLFREGLCCAASDFGNPFLPNSTGNQIVLVTGNSNSPLSWPANPALAANFNPSTGLPVGGCCVEIWGAPQTNRTPYVFLYSSEVQHELPGQFILTVGYQGSQSRKMLRIVGLNRVYPQLNPVLSPVYFPTTDVNGHFNALNVSATRRYSHGLQFFGKYQFGRGMDGGSWEGAGGERDPFYPPNQTWDWGPSDFDVTHNMLFSALYDLPVLRNRHDAVGKAFGGWQVNGTYQFHTGFPWSPISSINCPRTPSGADTLCPALASAYLGKAGSDYSNDTFMKVGGNFPGIVHPGDLVPNPNNPGTTIAAQCSNTTPSTRPGFPYFDVCTVGPPFVHRNSFRGPRYQTFDMSFVKSTAIPFVRSEGARLDLRVNFFNLFNKLNLQPFGARTASTTISDGHFGRALGALAGRVIEFQTRLTF